MSLHLYAIRLEPDRLVAAEVEDQAAALLLDGGRPVLLGSPFDLARIAVTRGVPLALVPTKAPPDATGLPVPSGVTGLPVPFKPVLAASNR